MTKAIVVFGPTTKNTEALAKCVADGLRNEGAEVTLKNVTNTDMNELGRYDTVVLFCAINSLSELKNDSIDLYADMKDILVAGKKAAISGPEKCKQLMQNFPELLQLRRAA